MQNIIDTNSIYGFYKYHEIICELCLDLKEIEEMCGIGVKC